jgi:predicted aldo/keto reductase-like oxidoreductase
MQYRDMGQTGDKISVLGYGCMRFPKKNGRIDEARTEKQINLAIRRGVNYFDTAYIYPQSESVLGKILAKGHREKVKIATKMPPFMVHSVSDMESVLDTQLKRLQTDHIDYYLMHALNSKKGWQRIRQLGAEEFLQKAKQSGKIRHVGFSYHGDGGQFKEIIDDYPWDFCQIQYNYMDEYSQAGREGLNYAAAKGLGVAVMEPLRGGLLARKLPSRGEALFAEQAIGRTPAEWALRWVWNHPQVAVVLSGMNEESQIEENARAADDALPDSLTPGELHVIAHVREMLAKQLKVGCTGCGYCLPCPAGVNIPLCFNYYNEKHLYNSRTPKTQYLGFTTGLDGGVPSYASLCRECGKCEKHCPQHLPIRKHLKEVAREMESVYFKPVVNLARVYYNIRGFLKKRG